MHDKVQAEMAAATTRFNELSTQGETKRQELEEIEAELKRLQGEYRGYEKLLKQPDPAKTIDVEPSLEAAAKPVKVKK